MLQTGFCSPRLPVIRDQGDGKCPSQANARHTCELHHTNLDQAKISVSLVKAPFLSAAQ